MLGFLIENEIHLGGRARPPAGPASPKKLLEPSAAGIPTGGAWDGGYQLLDSAQKLCYDYTHCSCAYKFVNVFLYLSHSSV